MYIIWIKERIAVYQLLHLRGKSETLCSKNWNQLRNNHVTVQTIDQGPQRSVIHILCPSIASMVWKISRPLQIDCQRDIVMANRSCHVSIQLWKLANFISLLQTVTRMWPLIVHTTITTLNRFEIVLIIYSFEIRRRSKNDNCQVEIIKPTIAATNSPSRIY